MDIPLASENQCSGKGFCVYKDVNLVLYLLTLLGNNTFSISASTFEDFRFGGICDRCDRSLEGKYEGILLLHTYIYLLYTDGCMESEYLHRAVW